MTIPSGLPPGVERAVTTFEVHGPTAFSLLGRRHEVDAPAEPDPSSASPLAPAAFQELADLLYEALHCRPPAHEVPLADYSDWTGAREFARALSEANTGRGTWDPDWVVTAVAGDGRIVAERYGLRFWMAPDRFRAESSVPAPGGRGAAWVPKEQRHLQPGFYMSLGDAPFPPEPRLVRVYWHLRAEGAVTLVREITGRLNAAGVPFWHKVVSEPRRFLRADAGVTYLPYEAWADAVPHLADVHHLVRPALRSTLSVFVKPVGHGVGVGEDARDGSSFGQHRSRLVARAIVSEPVLRARVENRPALVAAAIRAEGFDPEALYLAPGSPDRYRPFEECAP